MSWSLSLPCSVGCFMPQCRAICTKMASASGSRSIGCARVEGVKAFSEMMSSRSNATWSLLRIDSSTRRSCVGRLRLDDSISRPTQSFHGPMTQLLSAACVCLDEGKILLSNNPSVITRGIDITCVYGRQNI